MANAHCTTGFYDDCHQVCEWIDDGAGDWNDDNPSGGAGGAGEVTPPPITDEGTPDPCTQSAILSNDAALCSQVNRFYDKNWIDKHENGWIKTSTGKYIYPGDGNRGTSSMHYTSDQVEGQTFTELYHCHPASTGQSCIPSKADLGVMARYYITGHIAASEFSYGVISEIGCLSIIISNAEQFYMFAEKIYNNSGVWDKAIADNWQNDILNVISGTIEASVGKLIKFFKKSNAGLSVMFRPMSHDDAGGGNHGKNWQAKDVDKDGHYGNKNCR